MAPKKVKGAISVEQTRAIFSETEKALYEHQLADCKRKVARLRKAVDDYEIRNEELQKAYDTLDEDRADVIAFFKKTLNIKTEENTELKEKVKELEELRATETAEFNANVTRLENNFTQMKDQLTSEHKLLSGKINTLDEFRANRADLIKKYEKQEQDFEDQELKYKRTIYDTEQKFIIGKDKLKKEMEARLLQLAQQFQDASEHRIAASTHRVIRENYALNNQLDSLLLTQTKVTEQNEQFREDERASRRAMELAEEKRVVAMNKSIVQIKVIQQLTAAFENLKKQKDLYEKKLFDTEKMQLIVHKLTKDNAKLLLHVRILEQNLHSTLGEQNKAVVETAKLVRERETYKKILKESAFIVHASLKLDYWCTLDPSREVIDRKIVLTNILQVINQYLDAARAESMESLVSLSNIYEKGDLGFEVKSIPSRMTQAPATALAATSSIQSLEDKHSAVSVSSILSSKASIKTIPIIELLPLQEEEPLPIQDSLPSFTVASWHSSRTVSSEESDESQYAITDISKLLAISKLEMQKSLMADLAFSSISQRRMTVEDSNLRLDTGSQKSFDAIHNKSAKKPGENGGGGGGGIEDEQLKAIPGEYESKLVHFDGKPTQDLSEPTQDAGDPVTVAQEDAEEDKKKESSAE